jgi:2-hydroxychromene-2-carboxylate isomerase
MDHTQEDQRPRCYFAFRSPYSRLGLHKLAASGVDAELIPFTGPPEDAPFADPTANKYKLAYYQQDVLRMTWRMSLPIALPDPFDVDFTPANRAFIAADQAGCGLAFALAISDARWGAGRNVSDPAVIADAAKAAGWDGYDAEAVASDPAITAQLAANRDRIAQDGVFGVPFLVDGRDKYWGQDRFDIWLEERAVQD